MSDSIYYATKYGTVRRAQSDSRQPRFAQQAHATKFAWLDRFHRNAIMNEPEYSLASNVRDRWLSEVWRQEPFVAGVINSVVNIDANRGWTLVGGRNQVSRYRRILKAAEQNDGWRYFIKRASTSFWTTDLGAVVETGRDGENGPLRAVWNVDPTRCRLSGDPDFPLWYYALNHRYQQWPPDAFFRVASMPAIQESYFGLGFCALSRAIRLAQLLHAVLEHDLEKMAANVSNAILTVSGVTQQEFQEALRARKARLEGQGRDYYAGLMTLISTNPQSDIRLTLTGLSELPDNFDHETTINLFMYGLALCFGYDPREFWPVSGGRLGTARETEQMAEKATGKGQKAFSLEFQDRMQAQLPASLHFEFDERSQQDDLADAQIREAQLEPIRKMAELRETGEPVLSRDEVRQLLAAQALIPGEWVETTADVSATDEQDVAARMLEYPQVRRACEIYYNEPIVAYRWPHGTEQVLWSSGEDAMKRSYRKPEIKPQLKRSRKLKKRATLYADADTGLIITDEDVEASIAVGGERLGDEYEEILNAEIEATDGDE